MLNTNPLALDIFYLTTILFNVLFSASLYPLHLDVKWWHPSSILHQLKPSMARQSPAASPLPLSRWARGKSSSSSAQCKIDAIWDKSRAEATRVHHSSPGTNARTDCKTIDIIQPRAWLLLTTTLIHKADRDARIGKNCPMSQLENFPVYIKCAEPGAIIFIR